MSDRGGAGGADGAELSSRAPASSRTRGAARDGRPGQSPWLGNETMGCPRGWFVAGLASRRASLGVNPERRRKSAMSKYVANNVASVGNTLLTDPESVFYSAVHAAEATFQAANKSTAALLKAADIAKHRA